MTREPIARQMPTLAPTTSRRGIIKGLATAAIIPVAASIPAASADAAVLAFARKLDLLEAEMDVAWEAFTRSGEDDDYEAEWHERTSAMDDELLAMLSVPASTMEGLQFKAKYGRHYPEVVQESIANDLRRMQGLDNIYPDTVSPLKRRLAGDYS